MQIIYLKWSNYVAFSPLRKPLGQAVLSIHVPKPYYDRVKRNLTLRCKSYELYAFDGLILNVPTSTLYSETCDVSEINLFYVVLRVSDIYAIRLPYLWSNLESSQVSVFCFLTWHLELLRIAHSFKIQSFFSFIFFSKKKKINSSSSSKMNVRKYRHFSYSCIFLFYSLQDFMVYKMTSKKWSIYIWRHLK